MGTLGAMPIPARLLGDDEEVLVDVHPHWKNLVLPAALSVAAIVAVAVVTTDFPKAPVAVAWLLAAMVAVPVLWLAVRVVRWLSTSTVVTTHRVLLRRGVFRRSVAQLRLQRVLEVHYTQSISQRMIGSGRLILEVVGEEGPVAVDDVRRPKSLQRVIAAQLEAAGALGTTSAPAPAGDRSSAVAGAGAGLRPLPDDRTPPHGMPPASDTPTARGQVILPPVPHPAAPAPAQNSVHQQLVELDDLRRRGIVTQAEFDQKKADLLSRL